MTGEKRVRRKPCRNLSKRMRKPELDPYQELANAIVIMAAKDYRHALRIQRRNPGSQAAKMKIDEIEHFFRSEWYQVLTNIDGEMLIKKLREEQ